MVHPGLSQVGYTTQAAFDAVWESLDWVLSSTPQPGAVDHAEVWHLSNAATPRPDREHVWWIGWVEPANRVDGTDLWIKMKAPA